MLVFTRTRNEAIVIGDGVEVRVLRVGRDGVRLGVTAPPSVAVHRREIYDQITEANRTAAVTDSRVRVVAERLRRTERAGGGRVAAGPEQGRGTTGSDGSVETDG